MLLLATLLTISLAQEGSEPTMLPCNVPYECATDIRVENATATWRMTFDRRWPGIYDTVHWDIRYTDGRCVEYLANLVRPVEGRMYYQYFVRERRGVWYTLGIRKRWTWRQVRRPSAENNTMVTRAQLLYSISYALRHDSDPKSLKF